MAKRTYFALFVLCVAVSVYADSTGQIEFVQTQATSATTPHTVWGLTREEWQRYEEVIAERRGTWSPGLDPVTALGVSADTAAERDRFAELYVRTEFERTRKELAFQLAVDRAWARLYPSTPRLQSRGIPNASLEPRVRYALIVSTECPECDGAIANRLSRMIDQAQEGVDVHVVGTEGDDQQLRDWVLRHPKVLQALKAGLITVNHGHEFADLSVLPAIYAKTEAGQWSREL